MTDDSIKKVPVPKLEEEISRRLQMEVAAAGNRFQVLRSKLDLLIEDNCLVAVERAMSEACALVEALRRAKDIHRRSEQARRKVEEGYAEALSVLDDAAGERE